MRGKSLRGGRLILVMIDMMEEVSSGVVGTLKSRCEGTGVTCHPFLLGWYHDRVASPFRFPGCGEDTLAVLLVSTPDMFEHLFLPYLSSPHYCHGNLDPLDQCFKHFFSQLKEMFPSQEVVVIHDFERCPRSRKPGVLVQTAGHVAGVAHYYQRKDVTPDPWPTEKEIFGVSIHPDYGGWFAFRGILIFKDIKAPDLRRVEPQDCVPSRDMRAEVLERYNGNWQDWTFRDVVVGGPKVRYSEQQKLYFSTEPGKRFPLIAKYCTPDQSM